MGKRLRAKHKKRQRDLATAYAKGEYPAEVHKPSKRTSRTTLQKKAYRWKQ